jgi:hypothetical protein
MTSKTNEAVAEQGMAAAPAPYVSPLLSPTGLGRPPSPSNVGASLTPRSQSHYVVAPMGKGLRPSGPQAKAGSPEEPGAELWNSTSSSILSSIMGSALGVGPGLEMLAELMFKTMEAGESDAIKATGLPAALAADPKPGSQAALGYGLRTAASISKEEEEAKRAADGGSKSKNGSGWSVGSPSLASALNQRRPAVPMAPAAPVAAIKKIGVAVSALRRPS